MISSADEGLPGQDVSEKTTTFQTTDAKDDQTSGWRRLMGRLASFGRVELRGITPIPIEERTVKRTINVFTLWWSINANILAITFGMLGPAYGLNLRDSSLVILFFTLLTSALPAYLSTLGPMTGMRQMIQARFSFGRWLVAIPVLLNLATLAGFCIIMAVIGGQCLSAVGDGHLSPAVGIVIIGLLSLLISFCGFSVLHTFDRYAWIPSMIAMVIAVGCGGSQLKHQAEIPPSTPQAIVSFGMVIASYVIPWACLASDFTTYLEPSTSRSRIFLYAYSGLVLPTVVLMVLGAAIAGATPNVPAWQEAFDANNVGGSMAAMLAPAGGFGKFVTVVLAFTILGNMSATSYSITLNFQLLVPALKWVPRYLFAIVIAAIIIPVSIAAANDFFDNLENFITLIAYWSASFIAVVLVEYLWFRRTLPEPYEFDAWDDASRLPPGVAAIVACVLSFGLVIPSMAEVWYTGPIAEKTGDLGFEFAFVVSALLYLPFRTIEKRMTGR